MTIQLQPSIMSRMIPDREGVDGRPESPLSPLTANHMRLDRSTDDEGDEVAQLGADDG